MAETVDDRSTLRWFALSALRRLHGWGELRIRDALKRAAPGHWRSYPQREVSEVDWAMATTKIDCEADTATILRMGLEPGDNMWWSERIGELALLLPADADGAPLLPTSDGAAISLPADYVASSPVQPTKPTFEATQDPALERSPPVQKRQAKEWVAYAIDQRRDELAGLGPQPAAKLLANWMAEGLYSPVKAVSWNRIKNIAIENKYLPIKATGNRPKTARKRPK